MRSAVVAPNLANEVIPVSPETLNTLEQVAPGLVGEVGAFQRSLPNDARFSVAYIPSAGLAGALNGLRDTDRARAYAAVAGGVDPFIKNTNPYEAIAAASTPDSSVEDKVAGRLAARAWTGMAMLWAQLHERGTRMQPTPEAMETMRELGRVGLFDPENSRINTVKVANIEANLDRLTT